MSIAPPSPPVVGGAPANHSGRGNHPVDRVVIHSAVTPCEPGRARQLGAWNRDGTTGGSWHYAIDPDETIQCSWDSFVCWHAPPNPHSLGNEMCENPTWNPARWLGRNHRRTLAATARLTARQCLAYDIPIRWLSVKDLRAGRRGITSHHNVTKAFGQSTHTDPRAWPRRKFMRMVREEAARLLNEGDDDMPTPAELWDEPLEVKRGDEIRTTSARNIMRELEEEQDRQGKKLDRIIDLLEGRAEGN